MPDPDALQVLVIPVLIWIAALVFAILVFKPQTYSTNLRSPELAQETYQAIAAYKHTQLKRAHTLVVLGFVPLLVNVLIYLIWIPAPPGP